MIKTLDGVVLKRGEIAFIIGITTNGEYAPCMVKVHSKNPDYSIPDESKVYSTRAICQKYCDIKNKNHKQ